MNQRAHLAILTVFPFLSWSFQPRSVPVNDRLTRIGQMMELNTFPEIWREFKASYSQQSSLLRGFDALALFAFLTAVLQAAYAAVTNGYPFHSLISSLCGSLGLMVLAIAIRIHLTPSISSPISPTRAFVEFTVSLSLLFWFVWNIMI